MEYDKHVARLEAALIERAPNVPANLADVFDACDDRRKLHLALLLNVDGAVDFSKLSVEQERRFRPLHTLQNKIDRATFFEIVSKCRLWSYFFECVSFLPVTTDLLDSDVVERHDFERGDPFASTAFVAAMIRRSRMAPDSAKHLEHVVDRHVDKLFQKFGGKQPAENILSTLFLSQLALADEVKCVVVDSQSSLSRTGNDALVYFNVNVDAVVLGPAAASVVDKLLNHHYVELIKAFSINYWIDMVDQKAIEILKHPSVGFWTRDDYPPSNLQLLIAHYSFEIVQNLARVKAFSSVAQILKSFARNFDRKIELHLEDLGPDELMLASRSEDAALDGGWRREAYVQHLASLKPDLLLREDVLDFLADNSAFLRMEDFQKFYEMAVNTQSPCPPKENILKLLESILLNFTVDEVSGLAHRHLIKTEFSGVLKSRDFDENCRILMNRSTLAQTADYDIALAWFVMQSPVEFVHFLIDEATENGGKISVAVAILGKFPDLSRIAVFDRLLRKFDALSNPGKNVANATVLVKSLATVWREQGKIELLRDLSFLFYECLASNPDADFTPQLEPLTVLVEAGRDAFDEQTRLVLTRGLSLVLTASFESPARQISDGPKQEMLLRLIRTLADDDAVATSLVRKSVSPALRHYFDVLPGGPHEVRVGELLSAVRRSFFSERSPEISVPVESAEERAGLILALASGLVDLLPSDLKRLATAVEIVEGSKSGHDSIIFYLIAAAELLLVLRPDLTFEHLEYIVSSLGQALAAGFENGSDPQKLNSMLARMCRLLHRVDKTDPDLVSLLQMCLVNVVNQLFECTVGAADSQAQNDLQTTGAAVGLSQVASEVDIKSLLTSLLPLPACDAKTLCLAKVRILTEAA